MTKIGAHIGGQKLRQRPDSFTLDKTHPLARGLVFAGLGAHAGGTHYHDASVYGNHGTIVGATVAHENGRNGLVYDGSGDQVDLTYTLNLAANFSFACWIKVAADYTRYAVYGNTTHTPVAEYKDLFYLRSISFLRSYSDASAVLVQESPGATDYSIADVAHIALVRTTANGKFYRDGNLVETFADPTSHSTAIDTLGASHSTNLVDLNGTMLDPMFLARALTASEVSALADPGNVMLSGLILPPARKWWPVTSGGGPATYTATAALFIGGATGSASATHTAPTYDADAALDTGGASGSAFATFTPLTYTADAALDAGAVSAAGSATFTAPIYDATAALSVGGATAEATATFAVDTFTATADLTVGTTTLAATATYDAGTFTATAALTTGTTAASGTATFTTPTYDADAAVTAGAVQISTTAAFALSLVSATASLTVGSVVVGTTATFTPAVQIVHYHVLEGPSNRLRVLEGPSKQLHSLTGT